MYEQNFNNSNYIFTVLTKKYLLTKAWHNIISFVSIVFFGRSIKKNVLKNLCYLRNSTFK